MSYAKTRFIVFWSKNPLPLLPYLDTLREKNIGCYIQYTLNNYEAEGLEPGVPPLERRIDTFLKLSAHLGKQAVIWRFDPLVLTDSVSVELLLEKSDISETVLLALLKNWFSVTQTSGHIAK